ncbi:uncharacterized protein [Arachis hypogaea]|uniref:uncharacterized protein n=1 Tax=Arachis hypogaea TaxID=3818 RepID=UPI003B21EF01
MGLGRSRPRLRLRGLCFGNATPHVRASSSSRAEFSSNDVHESSRDKADESGVETGGNNQVMVVMDSSFEAKGALDWALSRTIQRQDNVVLVHVAKPTSREEDPLPYHNARSEATKRVAVGPRTKEAIINAVADGEEEAADEDEIEVVEYCLKQNSPCMTIAVRRKIKKLGGYLISTRGAQIWSGPVSNTLGANLV